MRPTNVTHFITKNVYVRTPEHEEIYKRAKESILIEYEQEWKTRVTDARNGAICLTSCAFIFLGGMILAFLGPCK